jgi:zinc/manganese transport system substrate-binding protein
MSPSHRLNRRPLRAVATGLTLALVLAACGTDGDDGTEPEATGEVGASADPITVVATTSILGDIVGELVGEDGEVTVLMGPGVDPHAYSPSARDAATMREADLVVANGLQLEESLVSTLEATEQEGVPIFELAPLVDPIEYTGPAHHDHGDGDDHGHDDEGDHAHDDEGDHAHDDEGDHAHDDEGDHAHDDEGDHAHDDEGDHAHDDEGDHAHDDEGDHAHDDEGDHAHDDEGDHAHDDEGDHAHDDDHAGHDHGPEDPHVWFDPQRMVTGVQELAAALAEVAPQVDADEWDARAADYVAQLEEIDAELEAAFDAVPDERRTIVTNHDALGYLADRYELEVVGTVIPGASTQVEADPRGFSELIAVVEDRGIDVVFADNTDSTRLAEQLASEVVGRSDVEVEVVTVATDALGEPGSPNDTYLGLLRETGTTIAERLAAS